MTGPVAVPVAWSMLVVAGLLDVAWAVAMKQSDGYTRLGWSLGSLALLAGFVVLLGRALKVLDVGTAYAVRTGIGAAGTLVAGALLFGETLSAAKLGGVGLVLAGIAVLKLVP